MAQLPDDLEALAREVVDTNRYMTLGTTEPDARPRVSPVYFTHAGYGTYYWVSSPLAQHSKNVAARPDVVMVIFDSTVGIGHGRAVYLDAVAAEVPRDELAAACVEAYARVDPAISPFTPDELSGDQPLRLYRAVVTRAAVHLPGRDSRNEGGVDTRRAVDLRAPGA